MTKTRSDRTTWMLMTAGAMAVLVPAAAQAQQADERVLLDPLMVSERAPRAAEATAPVRGVVADRTATGSKTAVPLAEVPQSVTVVGREEMDSRGAEKADEALRYVAGVTTQPFGPDSDTNWMFIRGFQATQTGVYQDGLQNYGYGFGGFFTDSFTLERVEVLRGSASVLYGGSNPGGLVNYVSKRPTGERLRYIDGTLEDSGRAATGLDIGDRIDETLAYRLTGRVAGGDGASDHAEGLRGTLAPSLLWTPNDRTRVTVLGSYTNIDEVHNGGAFLPYVGTVVDAPFGRIARDANFTEPDIDSYKRQQVTLGYELEHHFDSGLTARQNLRYGYSDVREVSLYPYGYAGFSPTPTDADNTLTRINFSHDTQVNTLLVDNQVEMAAQTGPLAHTLLAGLDYKYFGMDQVQSSGSATGISATNPQYGAAQGARSPYLEQDLVMNQVGVYLQDQVRFGDGWLATLNGRYDRVFTDSDGTSEYSSTEGQLSGRAGLAYTFAGGLTPYASVATFFNPVLGSSMAGAFKPETGTQYEVGLKYAPDFMDALFTVALFDLTRQNVVTGPYLAETQIGEVSSRGIELEARANITPDLRATAALTVLDLEITKDADAGLIGRTPYIVPERQASASLDYTIPQEVFGGALKGVVLGGGVRYLGASWADNENTLRVPSTTLYDGWIGYDADGWGVDLIVTNLTDEAYVASCQTQFSCGYGEGRTAKLKVHMTW